jgi:hypothetical protein
MANHYFPCGSLIQGSYMGRKDDGFQFVAEVIADCINHYEGIVRYEVKLLTEVNRPGGGSYSAGEKILIYINGKSATTAQLVSKPA